MSARALLGDCIKHLRTMEEDTFDSLVTDPPAGIGFMGKEWDHHKGGRAQWVAWMTEIMTECHRVLKPGAHGLVWALPRTSHWTATALEDAGFEVRDVVTHLFGSGFPKSLDVSKAIDKAAGASRPVVGSMKAKLPTSNGKFAGDEWSVAAGRMRDIDITAPATDAAKQWAGFGTALKPASEHWILVRKPCSEKTVAANVLKWGTGALNIDASRIPAGADLKPVLSGAKGGKQAEFGSGTQFGNSDKYVSHVSPEGRFPANLVLSHDADCLDDECSLFCPVRMLDEQSGKLVSGKPVGMKNSQGYSGGWGNGIPVTGFGDSGGASRFFYCAKISKSERNAGCETGDTRKMSTARLNSGDKSGKFPDHDTREKTGNHHPTVKPKKLMTYLIRMVTPPGGAVLDPFMGSGSTGIAASEAGYTFMGIEQEPDYYEIATKRIQSAEVAR